MLPPSGVTATNVFPSADEATEPQDIEGRLFETHVVPELVEVKTPFAAASNLHPSADEATEDQSSLVAAVGVHVIPELVET